MADQVANSDVKQRRFARYSFIAAAEVMSLNTDTRLSSQTSELGMGGCYVDTLNPFPEGTLVRVRIVRDDGSFESSAKVVYILPGFGMGLAFTDVTHEQRLMLEKWIAALAKS